MMDTMITRSSYDQEAINPSQRDLSQTSKEAAESGAFDAEIGLAALAVQSQLGSSSGLAAPAEKSALKPAAERSPSNMSQATSTNTAAVIAGLKPWSREWVFQPGDEMNSGLKPLFGGSSAEVALPSEMEEKLKTLVSVASRPAENTVNPVVLRGLRETGGDAGVVAQTVAQAPAVFAGTQRELTVGTGSSDASVAGQAVVAGHDDPWLSSLLAMQGVIEGVESDGAPLENRENVKNVITGVSGLSGGEFLHALSSVREGSTDQGRSGKDGGDGFGYSGGRPELRLIEGGHRKDAPRFDTELGSHSAGTMPVADLAGVGVQAHQKPSDPILLKGHVTKGAMASDRLSSESLLGVSSGIRNLSGSGGGEIRIRLHPENLGELHLRVVTQGNNVQLKIQASDENAKKVLEESISHLKDSLASHRLNLTSVDLSIARGPTGSELHGDHGQQRGQADSSFRDTMHQGGGGHGDQGRDGWREEPRATSLRPQAMPATSAARVKAADVRGGQRLDVRA